MFIHKIWSVLTGLQLGWVNLAWRWWIIYWWYWLRLRRTFFKNAIRFWIKMTFMYFSTPTQIWHRPPKKSNVLFDLISKVWEPRLPGETSQMLGCLMTQSNTGRQLPSGEVKYVAKQKATIRGWFSCVVIRKLWPKRLREKASWHQRWYPLVPHPLLQFIGHWFSPK